jgi:hypothetical protein
MGEPPPRVITQPIEPHPALQAGPYRVGVNLKGPIERAHPAPPGSRAGQWMGRVECLEPPLLLQRMVGHLLHLR